MDPEPPGLVTDPPPADLVLDGRFVRDRDGRALLLRGVNLGGSSKVPTRPDGRTDLPGSLEGHRDASFVGRPFALRDADDHLARIASWGFRVVRLLTTWEAVAHAGPGEADRDYLDFLRSVAERCAAHGLAVVVDPHQDVWSRFTGGDGAPGWTLEALGMDLDALGATGAAVRHVDLGEGLSRMAWTTNYARLGAALAFTVFLGGDEVAPATRVDGAPVGVWLRARYCDFLRALAGALADLPHVLGFGPMNEPSTGWLGLPDLAGPAPAMLRMGPSPTPWESLCAAAGRPTSVGVYQPLQPEPTGRTTLNPDGVRLWRGADPLQSAGVWSDGPDGPRLHRPDHLARSDGRAALGAFLQQCAAAWRDVDPDGIVFVEGAPGAGVPPWPPGDRRAVNAGHWYDGVTLFTGYATPGWSLDVATGQPVEGAEAVRRLFVDQVGAVAAQAEAMGGLPTLVGEVGVPFDLNERAGYTTGDWSDAEAALHRCADALDAHLLGATWWNYTADHTDRHGDGWNGEDLSLYRAKTGQGRGVGGVARPYARAVAGTPTRMTFEVSSRVFVLEFDADPTVTAPTEVSVPGVHYPAAVAVEASAGVARHERARGLVTLTEAGAGPVTLTVRPA